MSKSVFLKRLLLVFWAVWLTIVFTTNLLDAGKAVGLLDESWAFASGNYRFLAATTARYGTPEWLSGVLFGGVICWEGVAAVLFWLACWTYRGMRPGPIRYAAFAAGLSLWAAFILADEVFIAYPGEGTHIRLFVAQLVTLLAVELIGRDLEHEPRPAPGALAHITLAVRDVPAASAFFANAVGWRPIARPGNVGRPAAWLEMAPGQELHLIEVPNFEASSFEGEFGRHVAFSVPLPEFSALRGRLSAYGAELIEAERKTPFARFFFRSPDGYLFEVVERDRVREPYRPSGTHKEEAG